MNKYTLSLILAITLISTVFSTNYCMQNSINSINSDQESEYYYEDSESNKPSEEEWDIRNMLENKPFENKFEKYIDDKTYNKSITDKAIKIKTRKRETRAIKPSMPFSEIRKLRKNRATKIDIPSKKETRKKKALFKILSKNYNNNNNKLTPNSPKLKEEQKKTTGLNLVKIFRVTSASKTWDALSESTSAETDSLKPTNNHIFNKVTPVGAIHAMSFSKSFFENN